MSASPRRSLWHHPDFLRLWTAETISQFGTQVSQLAIPLVAALILKVPPFEFALLGVLEFLPFILFSLPAGAWVDRLRRRPILIIGDLGRALSLASIPVAYALGGLTIWQLYMVGFVNGVLTVFFDVAYQSYLPSLVDRDQILEGNSKLEVSRTIAQTAGPTVGGALVGLISAPFAIIMDSLSFLGSAFFVWGIRSGEPTPDRHVDAHGVPREGLRREVAAGLRYVVGNRYLRSIAACTGSSNLFSNMAFATFLLFVVQDLHLEPLMIGVVFGLGNLGSLVGAVTAARVGLRLGVGPTIVGASFLFGPALLLVPIATPTTAVPLLIASSALGGFSGVVYNVTQVSFRQAITPAAMQGRMNATMRFIVWGTIPVGAIIGGAMATTLGIHRTIWIGAILSTLPFLFVLLSPVRTLKEMPEPALETQPEGVTESDLGIAGDPR
jgi:MFS family permease